MAANATIARFGYPDTLLAAYGHWLVLLRPQQATLGSLVLACTGPAQAFGDLSAAASAELARVARDIETTLAQEFAFDRINYLMLMMVDPHVHFHVLPRYAAARSFDSTTFEDPGWPGPPRLDHHTPLGGTAFAALRSQLVAAWPEVGR